MIESEYKADVEKTRVWEELFREQAYSRRTHFFHEIWQENALNLDLDVPTVIENIAIPHWRIVPIVGKSDEYTFFSRLSKSIFNVNMYLRKPEEKNYLPTRCRWHDSFGHLPFLFDEEYSRVLRLLANAYISPGYDIYRNKLEALYWYVFEFGICDGKIFGAGIISSPGESDHVINTILKENRVVDISDFDSLPLSYETENFQEHYLSFKDLSQVEETIFDIIAYYKRQ